MLRLSLIVLLSVGTILPGLGQDVKSADTRDKFEDLVKDAVLRKGLFDTYSKGDKLYLVIRPEQLDREFLFSKQIGRGIGTNGLTGGLMLNIFEADVIAFERHDDRIFLVQKPTRFTADSASAEAASVDLTFGSSVLEGSEIKATRADSAVAIEVHDWFVSDLAGVGDRLRSAVSTQPGRPGRVTLQKGKSHLEYVKAFEANVNIRAKLSFEPAEPVSLSGVADSRSIPVSIDYTIASLPERPMTPRLADDRVGFFMTVKKDFSNPDRTFFKRYVNRWRLECDGMPDSDGLCDPKKPITYYIDRTVPEEYRQALMDGVEAFKPAFVEAGFRNAISAQLLPDSADAEDIRYATLRWNYSDQPGWGAIGPSTVDPRTGEVLDADLLFEGSMVLGFKRQWWNLIDPTASLTAMYEPSESQLAGLRMGGELSTFGAELMAQSTLLQFHLMANGLMQPGDPVPAEFVNEYLKWVTMHEVGHTLGLRHNFRSSADTPVDKLYDKEWAEGRGVYSSVMEYPSVNLAPDGDTGYYVNPGLGSYDFWAIAFGYSRDAEKAEQIARLAAKSGHAYGTDEDAVGPGAMDPTVNIFDLGGDPLAWARQRVGLVRDLWGRVPEFVLSDDESYYETTIGLQMLLAQYVNAVGVAVKYIGGQYQYRDHVGDPDGRPPFVAVPKERQLEALAFVVESAFRDSAFAIPREVLTKIGANRWTHWGTTNNINGRIDYPLQELVRSVHETLLKRITNPFVFARILDAETKFGEEAVLTIPELMDNLTEAVWNEVWVAPGRDVSALRRDLQRVYLDRLTEILTNAPERTPADARAVVRLTLEDLSGRLSKRLSPPFDFDAYTLAHLRESKARIDRALEAGLDLKN